MAVGDDKAAVFQIPSDEREQGRLGDGPQLRDVPVVAGNDGGRRLHARARVPGRGDGVPGEVVQEEDRAEAHARVVHEVEAVGLRAGKGLFVGEDDPLRKIVDAHRGEEAVTPACQSIGTGEVLFHKSEGRGFVADEDAFLLPLLHLSRGSGVLVVAVVVAGRGHPQVDPHDVVPAVRVEPRLEFGTDDVVGRSHQ